MIFFTADLHLGHINSIRHSNRPFKDIKEMDEQIIKNFNSVVSKKDECYILGDFAWHSHLHYLAQLNGKKHLVLGNHDKANKVVYANFTSVTQIAQRAIEGQLVIMCHFPMLSWNARIHGSWHLYGHVHGRLSHCRLSNTLDVGVDCNNYIPISWDEVKIKIANPPQIQFETQLKLVEETEGHEQKEYEKHKEEQSSEV